MRKSTLWILQRDPWFKHISLCASDEVCWKTFFSLNPNSSILSLCLPWSLIWFSYQAPWMSCITGYQWKLYWLQNAFFVFYLTNEITLLNQELSGRMWNHRNQSEPAIWENRICFSSTVAGSVFLNLCQMQFNFTWSNVLYSEYNMKYKWAKLSPVSLPEV